MLSNGALMDSNNAGNTYLGRLCGMVVVGQEWVLVEISVGLRGGHFTPPITIKLHDLLPENLLMIYYKLYQLIFNLGVQ